MEVPLDAARLTEALVAQGPYAQVTVVEQTGSTNHDLIAAAASLPHLTALFAEYQTEGRGRQHPGEPTPRAWVAPPRSSLAVSVLFRPPGRPPLPVTLLPLAFGLAAVRALDLTLPGGAALKWPNDVIAGGRKVGGVLAAVAPAGEVVIGLGLNVNQEQDQLPEAPPYIMSYLRPGVPRGPRSAPSSPTPHPGSLATLGAPGVDRTWLAIACLAAAADLYQRWARGDGRLADGIGQRMETLGREVWVRLGNGRVLEGEAHGLAADGSLVLTAADGTRRLVQAGEITELTGRPN
ncbi:MAG: biotin--[acetyl-CoA-carboxylase] ligase [Bifidobacteriaceae bacterium]|jgi:BirA family biotin operon repressor/biotin-[acetyl-CoA-carboxylase] ligase|nr:biotin--[acetyl-CoA-carboxylase] ligase [Bifidobacteriaceae bacterium]